MFAVPLLYRGQWTGPMIGQKFSGAEPEKNAGYAPAIIFIPRVRRNVRVARVLACERGLAPCIAVA